MHTSHLRNKIIPYLFMLPGMAFLLVWLVYPMAHAFLISLRDWNPMPSQPSPFIGLSNYSQAFADPIFRLALKNTVVYVLITVLGQLILGVGVALILDRITRGRVIFRTLYYLPVITSWVVVSLLFKYMFNSSPAGMINYLLVNGFQLISQPISWLNEPGTAFIAIYCLGIWKGVGWAMIIILAALQSLPEEGFHAAAIDGANGLQILLYITLPLLLPTIVLVFIMLTIGGFQTYIPIALITGGGPLHRTEVLLTYMYNQAFGDLNYGYATAQAYILAGIVFVISQAQLRLHRPMDVLA
jgi:multiple sugar transport system permease protein